MRYIEKDRLGGKRLKITYKDLRRYTVDEETAKQIIQRLSYELGLPTPKYTVAKVEEYDELGLGITGVFDPKEKEIVIREDHQKLSTIIHEYAEFYINETGIHKQIHRFLDQVRMLQIDDFVTQQVVNKAHDMTEEIKDKMRDLIIYYMIHSDRYREEILKIRGENK